ncbi:30S ribosomal protein S17e [Candidatus Bathyarchaeota archaeon]|nr:MAG: 30S ribosomal protein S17e [Candidatus Bathyarchaeota archaeon]
MGRIRTQTIKRYAKLLLEKFPEKFTDDFEFNKRMLEKIAEVKSRKLRNQLAGYIASLVARKAKEKERIAAEEIEVAIPEKMLLVAVEK